jgi:hypothetical protein
MCNNESKSKVKKKKDSVTLRRGHNQFRLLEIRGFGACMSKDAIPELLLFQKAPTKAILSITVVAK